MASQNDNQTMLKIFSVVALVFLVFLALGPASWQPRSGLGWELDHFVGYFVFTWIFLFAWPRPLVVGGSPRGLCVAAGELAKFSTGSLILFCGGLVQRSRGDNGGSARGALHPSAKAVAIEVGRRKHMMWSVFD